MFIAFWYNATRNKSVQCEKTAVILMSFGQMTVANTLSEISPIDLF